jgi:hypothetical protein
LARLDRLRELSGRDLGDVLPNNVYICQQKGSPSPRIMTTYSG